MSAGSPTSPCSRAVQHSPPRALDTVEVGRIVRQFADACERALEAGFDGVELHAANGYLINQFLDSGSNLRTDRYGGSLATAQGTVDATPQATYVAAASLLDRAGVGYIHIAEADWDDAPAMAPGFKEALRLAYSGAMIYSGHYDRARAGAPLNAADPDHYFGDGERGYVDYPFLPGE